MRRALVALGHGADDLGNDVSGLVDDDGVSHAHVLAADLVDVVQGGTRDRRARDHHRVKLRNRRQHARTTHLDANLAQRGVLLLGRKLVGDGPAWCAGRKAKCGLAGKRVDLHHHAVDVIVEVLAMSQRLLAEGMHLGCGMAERGMVVHAEATVTQPLEKLPLAGHRDGRHVRDGIDEGLEVAVGRDARVLLAQASCGGVARIGKGLASGGVSVLVQANEAVLGHVDLATHLDGLSKALPHHAREACPIERRGHVLDREHIGRDVLARGAIAARGRTHKLAVAIGKRDAQAVNLELTGVGNGVLLACPKRLVRAGQPFVKLVETHGVIHGVHALGMGDRLELLAHVATHALRVAVWRDKLGMSGLDVQELVTQTVELGVGHLRRVKRIVAIGCMVEHPVELCRTARVVGATTLWRRRSLLESVPKERCLLAHRCVCHVSSCRRRVRVQLYRNGLCAGLTHIFGLSRPINIHSFFVD